MGKAKGKKLKPHPVKDRGKGKRKEINTDWRKWPAAVWIKRGRIGELFMEEVDDAIKYVPVDTEYEEIIANLISENESLLETLLSIGDVTAEIRELVVNDFRTDEIVVSDVDKLYKLLLELEDLLYTE